MVAALIRPHPLSSLDQREVALPEGLTLADIARVVWPDEAVHPYVVVFVGDVRVYTRDWHRVTPKAGACVRMGLTCFEGGGGNKGILGMIAMIAITIFAPYAAGAMGFTGMAATAVAAGITMVGALAVSAIFKPPMLSVGPTSNPNDAQTYTITGQANQATPYSPVLRVYGRHKIFPRLAAVPFTVNEGPNQFLYLLLDCGYGPLEIEDVRIGETAILNYRDVLYRVHPKWIAGDPLELYRNDTSYEQFGVELHTGVPEIRTSAVDASGLVLDFVCPRGLVQFGDQGERTGRTVTFNVELRLAGTVDWIGVRNFPVYGSRSISTELNVGQVFASSIFSFWEAAILPGMASIKLFGGEIPGVGDTLFLAHHSYHTITSVAGPTDGAYIVTISPPSPERYAGGAVQSLIMRNVGSVNVADATPAPVVFSMTIDVPVGRWEVRVTRVSAEGTTDRQFDTFVWSSLRSVADRPPIAVSVPHTLIEVKIRASEQLSGVVQNLNCVATSVLPVYDGDVPPEGAVHFDFLTNSLAPVYGPDLATLTVTRAGTATRVNAAGLIELCDADSPRWDFDPVTLEPLGLLIEDTRPNVCIRSQQFEFWGNPGNPVTVTAEALIAPDGTMTGDLVTENSTAVANYGRHQDAVILASTTYTVSIFLFRRDYRYVQLNASTVTNRYAWFDLDNAGAAVGVPSGIVSQTAYVFRNGWIRLSLTVTSGVGQTTMRAYVLFTDSPSSSTHAGVIGKGTGYWGGQIEPGSVASSYIPTLAASVTRAADKPQVADVSKFYNQAEGTAVVEFRTGAAAGPVSGSFMFASFDNGSTNERIQFRATGANSFDFLIVDNGVAQVIIGAGSLAPFTKYRAAGAYRLNDSVASFNGGAASTDVVGTLPTVTTLFLGCGAGGSFQFGGHLREFTYYPTRLANNQVVDLAGPNANLGPQMWVDQPTRNPAWAFADVLRGSASLRPMGLARLDVDRLKAWADYCDTEVDNGVGGFPEPRVRFDHVVDYATTVYQLLQSIASAGRASPATRDGRHGVIVDGEQTVPVQLFTPRNSWGFNARRVYLTEPNAMRVKFVDPETSWQEGEVVIYAGGYNAANATTFEDFKLFGVTRYTQATRDARYLKAQALLRREEFSIQVDVENLIAARGDLVAVQHDVMQVGGDSSRITAVAGARITLADPFGSIPAVRYGVRIRLADGTVTAPIEVTPQAPADLILSAVPTPAPKVGDLVAWGYLQTETGEYLVKQIAPGNDLTAQLSLVEIARDVYDADTGEIPAYVPPAGGRPTDGEGPPVVNLRVEQRDKTVGREPYADLVVTWDVPTTGGYPRYQVFRVEDFGVRVQLADTENVAAEVATNVRLLDEEVTTFPLTFGVIGIDAIGRQGEPAFVTFTPTDPFLVPGDVSYLSSNVHDKTTTLTWFAPNEPGVAGNDQVMFYEVRWVDTLAPTWGVASRVTELVPWNVTTVTVPSRNGAYLVKAITASKIESAVAASTVIAVEDIVIQDIWRTYRFAPEWDGIFDGTEVDASDRLVLKLQPDGTYPAVGVFYAADREIFFDLIQSRISATISAGAVNNQQFMADWVPLAMAAPLAGARQGVDWAASLWIEASAAAAGVMADWVPLASAAPLDPIPPVFGGAWRPLLHGEYLAREVRFAVVLESFQPNISPRVTQAGADIDFPERREEHADILIPPAGLDFTFARRFVFPPSVAVDLQDADAGDYVDRGAVGTQGFPLFVRDAFGVAKTGVVDVSVFGVGRVLP